MLPEKERAQKIEWRMVRALLLVNETVQRSLRIKALKTDAKVLQIFFKERVNHAVLLVIDLADEFQVSVHYVLDLCQHFRVIV